MYNTPITLDYEILEKKFLCIIHSDILEFCCTMLGIHCVGLGVGECQSEDLFACFGAKHTQWACSHETGRGGGKAKSQDRTEMGSQQERAGDF